MISEQFADTGWQIALRGPVGRYQVFGERSSGTNFVKRLVGRNTALIPTEELGWKHALPHMTAAWRKSSRYFVETTVHPSRLSASSIPSKVSHPTNRGTLFQFYLTFMIPFFL